MFSEKKKSCKEQNYRELYQLMILKTRYSVFYSTEIGVFFIFHPSHCLNLAQSVPYQKKKKKMAAAGKHA